VEGHGREEVCDIDLSRTVGGFWLYQSVWMLARSMVGRCLAAGGRAGEREGGEQLRGLPIMVLAVGCCAI
jgi:hypothetical protein